MNYSVSLLRADLKAGLQRLLRTAGFSVSMRRVVRNGDRVDRRLQSRIPASKIKRLIRRRDLALDKFGNPSWFYTAYQREDSDPLTNFTLDFICENIPKDSDLLITGCGTGIMLFFLIDQGFQNVEGFDFLDQCVLIANEVAELGRYRTKIWQADGFNPSLQKKYHLITAMHWVFSAWMGNYGNDARPLEDARSPTTRERLLRDFLSKYAPHLHRGGLFIVELTDAVADYRLPFDGGFTPIPLTEIYPVRHTPTQVATCAMDCGLSLVSFSMCCSYGHQPRTSYILKKL